MKLKAILLVLLLTVLTASHAGVWYMATVAEKGKQDSRKQDLKKEEAEKVKIVYKEKVKIEVRYRDRVKEVYQLDDPTGCLDTSLDTIGLLPR